MLSKLQQLKQEREQGFTLIELLVVILIIGILAAIAIPAFLKQRKSAVDSTVKSDILNAAKHSVIPWTIKPDNASTHVPEIVLDKKSQDTSFGVISLSSGGTKLMITPSDDASEKGAFCVYGVNAGGDESVKGLVFSSSGGGLGAKLGCLSEAPPSLVGSGDLNDGENNGEGGDLNHGENNGDGAVDESGGGFSNDGTPAVPSMPGMRTYVTPVDINHFDVTSEPTRITGTITWGWVNGMISPLKTNLVNDTDMPIMGNHFKMTANHKFIEQIFGLKGAQTSSGDFVVVMDGFSPIQGHTLPLERADEVTELYVSARN